MSTIEPIKHEIRTNAPPWFQPSPFVCPECGHTNTLKKGPTVSYYPKNYRESLDTKIDHTMFKCLCAKVNNRRKRRTAATPRSSCYTCSKCSTMAQKYAICEDLRCTERHTLREIVCGCATTCRCKLPKECPCEWCNCKCENTLIIHEETPRPMGHQAGPWNKTEATKTNGQKKRRLD